MMMVTAGRRLPPRVRERSKHQPSLCCLACMHLTAYLCERLQLVAEAESDRTVYMDEAQVHRDSEHDDSEHDEDSIDQTLYSDEQAKGDDSMLVRPCTCSLWHALQHVHLTV